MSLHTYLGTKGYTVLKKELTPAQEKLILKELTVKPFLPGSPLNHVLDNSYPVYRESDSKYYLPRYFGEKHFGPPKEIRLHPGNDVDVAFQGELRDEQKQIVQAYLDTVHGKSGSGGGLLEVPCGKGKTVMGIKIFCELKKKLIVFVNKGFLANQWTERLQQFAPTARVGRIQGPTIEIENKDVVIAMIQSVAMKEYPVSLFESFGLTIIDEVHHISSEVFSNTLFKCVTPFMLGLSATMNRKDGTTHVFKLFLGEIVYKGKRDTSDPVVVRAIDYYVDDPEFNTVVCDFRGNAQYSTMIVKLCEYNRRSEFILRILCDLVEENPAQQMIVLAHNKSLLKYLYDAIEHRGIASGSVGYYIGGMKEAALKTSETKTIIIATYSMAAEALDIKTLTTLLMVTPKTDIEQSVGRILREKHSDRTPLVIDIIDSHDLFQNQWNKRKAFYKKQNYKILYTTNQNYQKNAALWDVLYHPKSGGTEMKKSRGHSKDVDSLLQGTCLLGKPNKSLPPSIIDG